MLTLVRDAMKARPEKFNPYSPSNQVALRVSRLLRNQLVERGDPVIDPLLHSMRDVAYSKAALVTDGIVAHLDAGEPFADSEAYRKEFWALYWGELVMFEGPAVESAMVQFGRELKAIEEELTRTSSEQLEAVEKQLKAYSSQDVSRLTRDLISQRTVPEQLKNLVTPTRGRRVPQPRIEELKALRDHLHQALDQERRSKKEIGTKEDLPASPA